MLRKSEKFLLILLVAAMAFAVVATAVHGKRAARRPDLPRDGQTLIAWNNEMIRAHGRGDVERAAVLARRILSTPGWQTFIPANAVMGSALAHQGDYAAAEAFFKAALSGKGVAAPQPAVMNDYADTLYHLGRHDEAETYVRRAIALSGGKVPLFQQTLDEIRRSRAN